MEIYDYLKELNTEEECFKDVFHYAQLNQVPIIESDSLTVLKQWIEVLNVQSVLEVGTAIGYSTLHMLTKAKRVTTIEKDKSLHEIAISNFQKYGVSDRVHALCQDAKTVIHEDLNHEMFDLIFIDASKGNNAIFFDQFVPYLNTNGIVVVDNILVRGLVVNEDVQSKNKIKLKQKVTAFNEQMKVSNYTTSFLNVGDGLLIISNIK